MRRREEHPQSVVPVALLGVLLLLAAGFLLSRHAVPPAHQPFPDAHEYADAANRLAHGHGYTTTVQDIRTSPHIAKAVNPPRYPPGFSIVLAPFALVGHFPGNVNFGAKVVALSLVAVVAWAALELDGAWAAVVAVVLTVAGNFVRLSAHVVMGDALAAALAVAILPLVHRRTPRALYVAGFLAGYGVVVRESGVLVLACLLILLNGRDRIRTLVAAAPPIAGLAVYQWAAFGQPWRTGYWYWIPHVKLVALQFVTKHPLAGGGGGVTDQAHQWLAHWSCHLVTCGRLGTMGGLPNWLFYPLLMAGLLSIFSIPFVTLVGLGVAWRWRQEPTARLALLLTALTVVFYLPYFDQSARFMAGPAMMLVVWAAIGIIKGARRVHDERAEAPALRTSGDP